MALTLYNSKPLYNGKGVHKFRCRSISSNPSVPRKEGYAATDLPVNLSWSHKTTKLKFAGARLLPTTIVSQAGVLEVQAVYAAPSSRWINVLTPSSLRRKNASVLCDIDDDDDASLTDLVHSRPPAPWHGPALSVCGHLSLPPNTRPPGQPCTSISVPSTILGYEF